MNPAPTVFVVDDDEQARASVCALVRSMGIRAQPFASAEEFLAADVADEPGCLVTDHRMFKMTGADLLEMLRERGIPLPVVVLTAYADTALAVRVMKSGAITLLEKPYEENALWDAIRNALALDAQQRPQIERRREIQRRLSTLTEKERQVLSLVVAGKANKAIAKELDVSVRTVENRRRDIFEKMEAQSVAELVRMVIEAEGADSSGASE
jgi:FixJ family two-component response regulator